VDTRKNIDFGKKLVVVTFLFGFFLFFHPKNNKYENE